MSDIDTGAKTIFFQALERASGDDRARYVDEACAGNSALRCHVEQLLRAHQDAGNFLGGPWPQTTTLYQPITEGPGTVIGPYKLLEQIGEGGFGVVFMAEQERPVRRKVALKVIKPGMDTRQVIARFEAERQALALMDHPNIAKVLDAGTTPDTHQPEAPPGAEDRLARAAPSRRPYFVMELVRGVPITEYCDQCNLTTHERLGLFVQVCQAVQHAHQKGIIHRDLKPSNVMIAMQDGEPAPKVIDFGVAKALNQRLTQETLVTGFAQMLGTPMYMSPEQAEMSPLELDTRSDVYSLGVLLYELLTGTTPFEKSRLSEASFDELRRIIREEEPPKPSTRLSTLQADALSTTAEHRRTDPRKLRQQVCGDLDWIVMKALEKDRSRRYETVSALARDIERHLNDQPIEARPPSSLYKFCKFAHRNKTVLFATAAVLATLLLGMISLGASNMVIRREQQRTQVALKQAHENERQAQAHRQQAEAARQQAIANLEQACNAVDQMLTRVADERLPGVPQMELVRQQLLEDALGFYRRFLQQNSTDPALRLETARAWHRMGMINKLLGQFAQAGQAFHQAGALFEQLLQEFPDERTYRAALARTQIELGHVLHYMNRWEEMERAYRLASELYDALATEDPPGYRKEQMEAHLGMARVLQADGRLLEAYGLLRQTLSTPSTLPDYPEEGGSLLVEQRQVLAEIVQAMGRLQEAEGYLRQALELQQKLAAAFNDPGHQHNLASLHHALANLLRDTAQAQEAEKAYQAGIALHTKLMGDFPHVPSYRSHLASSHIDLGRLLSRTRRYAEAEEQYRLARELSEKLVVDFPVDLWSWQILSDVNSDLANLLAATNRPAEAESMYRAGETACRQAVALQEKLVAQSPGSPEYRNGLAQTYQRLAWRLRWSGSTEEGRLRSAEEAYRRAIALWKGLADQFASTSGYRRSLQHATRDLAGLLKDNGRLQDAEKA
ncbi:MAG: serine/threonine protein kinase, partial [Planctomycetes bacterium]|nr:serine/threonine protein kinase [Planctomycetota bacterium]